MLVLQCCHEAVNSNQWNKVHISLRLIIFSSQCYIIRYNLPTVLCFIQIGLIWALKASFFILKRRARAHSSKVVVNVQRCLVIPRLLFWLPLFPEQSSSSSLSAFSQFGSFFDDDYQATSLLVSILLFAFPNSYLCTGYVCLIECYQGF